MARVARAYQPPNRFIRIVAEFSDYFDSGVLVKIYHLEQGSPEVANRVRRAGRIPLPFLAEIEVRNALRVLQGRNQLTKDQLSRTMLLIESDICQGRLVRVSPEPSVVSIMAEHLSLNYAPATLCRTLDLLHVAMAKTLAVPRFHTGDKRQTLLARKAGMQVVTLKT